MTSKKSQFAVIGVACDYQSALIEITETVRRIMPQHSPAAIQLAFGLIELAFEGRLPGFQHLQAPYHNRCHTLEVAVCAARILHGLHVAEIPLCARTIDAAIIGALFHDTGYLKSATEQGGSGAQFTLEHVRRSVNFAQQSLAALDAELLSWIIDVIRATDHRVDRGAWQCVCEASERAASVTATADIIAQMSSREYLERLLFLYYEFREAGMGDFRDLHDLLEKTMSFYQITRERMFGQLDGTVNVLEHHFAAVLGEPRNHYLELIDRNIAYLQSVLQEDRETRLAMLKRGGIVEQVRQMI